MVHHRGDKRVGAPLWARLCTVLGAVLLLASTGLGAAAYVLAERYDNNIAREDYLPTVTMESDQPPRVTGPLTILLLGSDVRAGPEADPDDERTDKIMVIHLPRGLARAYLISVPRDAYVVIPPVGTYRGGKRKINAAYEIGGVPHVVRTVQQLTGLTMDHVVKLDFEGFKDITDAVGGVDMDVPIATRSVHTDRSWSKGRHHFDGAAALDYVRQRNYARSDYQRIDNQETFMRALLAKAASGDRLKNPVALDRLLSVTTKSITVDQRLQVKELAFALRGLRPADLTFITSPVAQSNVWRGGERVELLDPVKGRALYAAVAAGTVDGWVAANPPGKAG